MTELGNRRSFQRILTTRLGVTLAIAMAIVSMLLWVAAVLWTNHQLLVPLRAEAAHVAQLISKQGIVATDSYHWGEPHHRFADERIDPFFLQVFGADGRIVRSSENVLVLDAPYPSRLLAAPEAKTAKIARRLVRFSVGKDRLYALVLPIRSTDETNSGEVLGAVQVARFDLGQEAAIRKLGIGLGVGYAIVLTLLISLLYASSRRVLRPLESLTKATAALQPARLAKAITIPDDADLETAQLASTINQAIARIDASFAEVRRFTSDAAHELQTPLAILKGHIDVALRRERDPDTYKKTLQTLNEEVDSMVLLVRALLGLVRLDESEAGGEKTNLDLADAVADEVARLVDSATLQGVEIECDCPGGLQVETTEPTMIRQGIRNILENAVKYSDGGVVSVNGYRNNDHVTVRVQDGGRGIRSEDLPKVTERFFRARDVAEVPGHGLGLSIVQAVAERHGGRLEIESVEGEGTSVKLSLPASHA